MSDQPDRSNLDDVPPASAGAAYNDWIKQAVENLVEAEKRLIELASEQNALTLRVIRETLNLTRTAPTPALSQWVRQGFENFMEAQRRFVEGASQQTNQLFNAQQSGLEGQASAASQAREGAEGATDMLQNQLQNQVENLVEARKRWLDFISRQNAQFLSSVRQGVGSGAAAQTGSLADWAQQAMDNYVEVQKRWLDLATQFPFQTRKK